MSYRREVFDHERFDEMLAGYGHKEDIDFSYRVSRRYILVQTPTAKCEHMKTPTARMPAFHLQRMNLGNQFYLHRKNLPQDRRHRAALWWGLVGLFILNIGRALKHQRPRPGLRDGRGGVGAGARPGLIDPAVEGKGSRGVAK